MNQPNISIAFTVQPEIAKDLDILTGVMGCKSKNDVLISLVKAAMQISVTDAAELIQITNIIKHKKAICNHTDEIINISKSLQKYTDLIE